MTNVKFVTSHKLRNIFLSPVHLGFIKSTLRPEDSQNMTATCSVLYQIEIKKKLLFMREIHNLS